MKTILVPTDFSKIAQNAIDYAAEIAKHTKSKLILFHVYQIPIAPTEVPIIYPVDQMEKDIMEGLHKIEKQIHAKHGKNILVECQSTSGFPVEEIRLYSKKNKADLIVIGMQGAGYLTEKLIGSVTTSLIRNSKCPVLVIDKHVKFKSIKKIALACDYNEVRNKSIFSTMKEIANLFDSHVYVLNVVRELETAPAVSEAIAGIKLNHSLEDIKHSFHATKNEDVVQGINEFVDDKKIDMIVMIPRMHSILKNLFEEPHTKRMAFHTKTALLALHE